MEWVAWILAVVVLGLGAIVASGRWGELPATVTDAPRPHVPEGTLTGDDLRDCRLDVVIRGYSTVQVDELLDRLSAQLDGSAPASRTREPWPAPEPDVVAAEPPASRDAAEAVPHGMDESLFVPASHRRGEPTEGDSDQWRARLEPARPGDPPR